METLFFIAAIAAAFIIAKSFNSNGEDNNNFEKLNSEINYLKQQLLDSEVREKKLKITIEEKQNFLENCWKKIEELEPQKESITSKTNSCCNACDRPISYCVCSK